MVDIKSKRVFLFDLDDTLLDNYESTQAGLTRAYQKLCSECEEDISTKLPEKDFKDSMHLIYDTTKTEKGERKFFDYEFGVFEVFCNTVLPPKTLKLKHVHHSLAARLYWKFREVRYALLMPKRFALDVVNTLRRLGPVYCITQGDCNRQHTKAMVSDLEPLFADVVVTKDKREELKNYVGLKKFPKDETVMIGDRESDIEAGKMADIETILIHSGNPLHEGKDKFEKVKPDAEFKDLYDFLISLR